LREIGVRLNAVRDHYTLLTAATNNHCGGRKLDPEAGGDVRPAIKIHQGDLPAHLLLEALHDRPLHPAITAAVAREHDEREFAGLLAQILAASIVFERGQLIARVADHGIGRLGIKLRVLEHRDLGHTGESARLAADEVFEVPEVGNGIDSEDGSGIIALLLDQLLDLRRRDVATRVGFGSD
jgi:hypothetical protein